MNAKQYAANRIAQAELSVMDLIDELKATKEALEKTPVPTAEKLSEPVRPEGPLNSNRYRNDDPL